MKNVIIFTAETFSYQVIRLQEEIEAQGFSCDILNYRDLTIEIHDTFLMRNKGEQINLNDSYFIFRNIKNYTKRENFLQRLLVKYVHDQGSMGLNLETYYLFEDFENKLLQYYYLSKFTNRLITPTIYMSDDLLLEHEQERIDNTIIKPLDGSHGTGVKHIKNVNHLFEWRKYFDLTDYISQKYIENDGDIRVFIVDGKYVGAMHRVSADGSVVNNVSSGGIAKSIDIPVYIQQELLQLCGDLQADYIGFDIIMEEHDYYILEANRYCQFEGFEKITGINMATKLVELLFQKTSS